MIKTVALILVFADGFSGGHTTAAYFHSKAGCEREGPRISTQLNAGGHPTSFYCLETTLPAKYAKLVRD